MASVCFYFQVHQPWRIKKYSIFDIGQDHTYFDSSDPRLNNETIFRKVAEKCYLPANKIFLELLKNHPEFKISYSLSGVFLEQAESFMPEVIESFQALVRTGRVEILSETFYHSLSFLYSKQEFYEQVKQHDEKIEELFDVKPKIFRNTELIYNNDLAAEIENMGYLGILGEGVDRILEWRSPNFLYRPKGTNNLKVLLKNYKLSDDIAFRFSSEDWDEHPLTSEKFAHWVNQINGNGEVVNLFMDYETFGEHQWEYTGIFNFLRALPEQLLKHPDNDFVTPTEAVTRYKAHGELDIPYFISWADIERDLSAWLSNSMQQDAIEKLYSVEKEILMTHDTKLIEDWRRMQTSDHFYYMCTKWFADGDVHKYFNPYESPYEAFITYMNVFQDLKLRLEHVVSKKIKHA